MNKFFLEEYFEQILVAIEDLRCSELDEIRIECIDCGEGQRLNKYERNQIIDFDMLDH